ncbi:hypothetical protein ES319_D04G138800v1 [Gossypium barbadense]|uniref:Uncharacterized protein n=1 Tax=Gossypium barbadense TaxID=3634 RepID=A0A5J5RVK1_GOSBA|nr:hypothetical protein ES319_D04G138800v1 [Gossypium barbadense]KAB2035243.1 hypothetical protein ES319_D04G138800v1 [Gossypium barbadense]
MLPIKPSLLFILPPPLIVNFWSISSSWLLLFFINFAAFDLPLFALKISLLCYHKVLCCRHLASLGCLATQI